jgi:hypothetical protein
MGEQAVVGEEVEGWLIGRLAVRKRQIVKRGEELGLTPDLWQSCLGSWKIAEQGLGYLIGVSTLTLRFFQLPQLTLVGTEAQGNTATLAKVAGLSTTNIETKKIILKTSGAGSRSRGIA